MNVKKAIKIAGGVGALAERMGVAYQAVQRYRDKKLPANRVIAMCAAVDWRITPHQLAPELYPNSRDGIPKKISRAKSKAQP